MSTAAAPDIRQDAVSELWRTGVGAYQIADASDVARYHDRRVALPPEVRLWAAVIEQARDDVRIGSDEPCVFADPHTRAEECPTCQAWDWILAAPEFAEVCEMLGVSPHAAREKIRADHAADMARHRRGGAALRTTTRRRGRAKQR